MSHCVPSWDLENGPISASDIISVTRGYWDSMQPKRPMPLEHELEELLWERGPVVNKVIKRPRVSENDDAVLRGKPSSSAKDNVMDAVATELATSSIQEDDVAQFLYYPLDDSFEREYCSDFFEGMPSTSTYVHKDSLSSSLVEKTTSVNTSKDICLPSNGDLPQLAPAAANTMSSAVHLSTLVKAGKETISPKPNSSEKGMSSAMGRSSSLIPYFGSDTLPRSWTAQPSRSKWQANAPNSTCGKKPTLQIAGSPIAMPPPKLQELDGPPLKDDRSKLVNFSHFSRPASTMKANLQIRGAASGLSSASRMQRIDKLRSHGNLVADSSIIESNTTEWTTAGSTNCSHSKAHGSCEGNKNLSYSKSSDIATRSEDLQDSTAKVSDLVTLGISDVGRSFASATAEKNGDGGDCPEPTVTSSSGGSGHSGVRTGKELDASCKRKGRDIEDSECQSEDVEFESEEKKKQVVSRTTSKRSRAAEVHNLSERRRRDRINEKMRALQELIPHCNKSDKASMLDEAIEYLKTLQLQVQLMSMGGGMGMAPMVFPGGMQHFQVPQMHHVPPLGMGIGMGMGYSMGTLEIGASSSRPIMPLTSMHVSALPASGLHCQAAMSVPGVPGPSIPLQRCPGSGFQLPGLPMSNLPMTGESSKAQPGLVSVSASVSTGLQEQTQSSSLMDPYKLYSNQQHLQTAPQVISGNLCTTSMVQQTGQTSLSQANGRVLNNGEPGQGNTTSTG